MNVNVIWQDDSGSFVATIFGGEHLVEAMADRGYQQNGTINRPSVRPELFGQPTFAGLVGPMWDNGGLRYECPGTFRLMSV